MNRLKRIMLILLMVFLLPALFFSVYEISSMNDDEKMIRDIYAKQLDAILFSANQYADDRLDGWLRNFQRGLSSNDSVNALGELLQFNAAINHTFMADTVTGTYHINWLSPGSTEAMKATLTDRLVQEDSVILQLMTFYESGFQKIEALPIDIDTSVNEVLFLFHLKPIVNDYILGGFVVDTEIFIEEVLGPKLQQIALEQFELTVLQKATANSVYSTTLSDSLPGTQSFAYRKDLWLLPDYELAINTTGRSMQSIIKERTYTNLALLVILDLAILLGLWLIFKNVRKEVQLAQTKSDFVSNVSHEIRTPLALISMFAETLEMDRVGNDEKKKEYLGIIHKEANRLTAIVNKILSFSQMDADKRKLDKKPVVLNILVHEILDTYEYHLSSNGFEWEVQEDRKVEVMADKNALEEVLINLLDNAVKYSEEKKHIVISIGTEEGKGFVSVKDEGVGIAKYDLPYIFDKFYRVHAGDLARKKGTGLGLTLVMQIIDKLNGEIKVQSEVNRGTTFTVLLPLTYSKDDD